MAKAIDMRGLRFGKLEVTEITNKRDSSNGIIWECKCDCGSVVEANGKKLRQGLKTHCGCEKVKLGRKPIDRVGQKFGLLTVIKEYEKNENNEAQYLCLCDCGEETVVRSRLLSIGSKKSCGCLSTSLGEHQIKNLLIKNNIPFASEYIFKDLKTKNGGTPRFDFAIFTEDNCLSHLIEFDGRQHFEECVLWGNNTLENIQERDRLKDNCCKENGIRLIRIKHNETIEIEKLI